MVMISHEYIIVDRPLSRIWLAFAAGYLIFRRISANEFFSGDSRRDIIRRISADIEKVIDNISSAGHDQLWPRPLGLLLKLISGLKLLKRHRVETVDNDPQTADRFCNVNSGGRGWFQVSGWGRREFPTYLFSPSLTALSDHQLELPFPI